MRVNTYLGNGAYCYANSASMLLASIGENVPPSTIEVLGGTGLSASLKKKDGFLYFNNQTLFPDLGIGKALDILGFKYKVEVSESASDNPFIKLETILNNSAAIVGPLDMGYLVYNPNHKNLYGADHFVLAYKIEGGMVWLHDPAGFPHVGISKENLKKAWKAEKIFYRKGYYRFIHSPERDRSPSKDEVYDEARKHFREIYEKGVLQTSGEEWFVGSEAIEETAKKAGKGEISEEERAHFVHFALPLGSRRALDFAKFFDYKDKKLADLKRKQAELFGKAHTYTIEKNWKMLSQVLQNLAKVESEFKDILLKK